VNLIWHLTEAFSTGIEYRYGAQRTTNDALGQAGRIQGMIRLDF